MMNQEIVPENLYAVILAGGSGTRLWPLSRMLQPKQLLHLPGCQEGRSLLQETVARVADHIPLERLVVVTHYEQESRDPPPPGTARPGAVQIDHLPGGTGGAQYLAGHCLGRARPGGQRSPGPDGGPARRPAHRPTPVSLASPGSRPAPGPAGLLGHLRHYPQ